jgi:hypothetical protein
MDRASQPDGERTELERRMLEAARQDRVPEALGARMAEGLGVHVAAAAVQGGLAAGAKLGAPLFAKAGLWGVLSLALVAAVAGWRAAQPSPQPRRVAQAPRADAADDTRNAAAAAPPTPAAIADETGHAPVPRADEERTAAAPAAVFDDTALRAEVALLDRARNALRAGASRRALRLLDQHGQRFARARLAPEAKALRIEALVKLGSHEQAGSMSQEFASAYPSHPLSEHVAKLTAPREAQSPHGKAR